MSERSLLRELSIFLFIYLLVASAWFVWGPGAHVIEGLLTSLKTSALFLGGWYQSKLEGSAKIIAPVVTIISGTFAITTAYLYAENRLHFRLRDFLEREQKRFRGAREQLRRTIERPGPERPFEMPIFVAERLSSAMRELGWGSYFLPPQLGYVENQLAAALSQLEKQVDLSKQRHRQLSEQLALAHLLKGAMLLSRDELGGALSSEDRAKHIAALHHFEAALEANSRDLDALEYAAHVHVRLEQFPEAEKYIDRVIKLTAKDQKSLQKSRALRSKALIALNGSVRKPARAKNWIDDAVRALPDLHGVDQVEEADLRMLLGDTQHRLKAIRQARSQWEIAKAIYERIDSDDARAGLEAAKSR